MKEVMCQICGKVKVAIVDGSVKLRPGARIVCSECVPKIVKQGESCDVVDDLMGMFGIRPRVKR